MCELAGFRSARRTGHVRLNRRRLALWAHTLLFTCSSTILPISCLRAGEPAAWNDRNPAPWNQTAAPETAIRPSQNLRWQTSAGEDQHVAAHFYAPGQEPQALTADASSPLLQAVSPATAHQVSHEEGITAQRDVASSKLRRLEGNGPELILPGGELGDELFLTGPTNAPVENQHSLGRLFVPARSGAAPIVMLPPGTVRRTPRNEPTPARRPAGNIAQASEIRVDRGLASEGVNVQQATLVLGDAGNSAYQRTAQRPAPAANLLTQADSSNSGASTEMDFSDIFPGGNVPRPNVRPRGTPSSETPTSPPTTSPPTTTRPESVRPSVPRTTEPSAPANTRPNIPAVQPTTPNTDLFAPVPTTPERSPSQPPAVQPAQPDRSRDLFTPGTTTTPRSTQPERQPTRTQPRPQPEPVAPSQQPDLLEAIPERDTSAAPPSTTDANNPDFSDIFNQNPSTETPDTEPSNTEPPTPPDETTPDFGPAVEQPAMDDLFPETTPSEQPSEQPLEQPEPSVPPGDVPSNRDATTPPQPETDTNADTNFDDLFPNTPPVDTEPETSPGLDDLEPAQDADRDQFERDRDDLMNETMEPSDIDDLLNDNVLPRDETDQSPQDATDDSDDDSAASCERVYNKRDCCSVDSDCQKLAQRMREYSLQKISLDISPKMWPGEDTPEGSAEKQAKTLTQVPSRTWMDRDGQVIATGHLQDFTQGNVVIRDESGKLATVDYLSLGKDELCFLNAWWGLPSECVLPDGDPPIRNWTMTTYTWTASALCHKATYFEHTELERYGHSAGPIIQPLWSGAHFFTHVVLLPYNMTLQPVNECVYTLGHYRPGNCAPWLLPAFPLSGRAAVNQTLAVMGIWGILH